MDKKSILKNPGSFSSQELADAIRNGVVSMYELKKYSQGYFPLLKQREVQRILDGTAKPAAPQAPAMPAAPIPIVPQAPQPEIQPVPTDTEFKNIEVPEIPITAQPEPMAIPQVDNGYQPEVLGGNAFNQQPQNRPQYKAPSVEPQMETPIMPPTPPMSGPVQMQDEVPTMIPNIPEMPQNPVMQAPQAPLYPEVPQDTMTQIPQAPVYPEMPPTPPPTPAPAIPDVPPVQPMDQPLMEQPMMEQPMMEQPQNFPPQQSQGPMYGPQSSYVGGPQEQTRGYHDQMPPMGNPMGQPMSQPMTSGAKRMFSAPFSFEGRIRRTEYWLSALVTLIIYMAIFLGFFLSDKRLMYHPETMIFVMCVVAVPLIWFMLAQGAKRCHDCGKGSVYALFYVPMLFVNGDFGPNQYGPNPKGE